MNKHLIRIIPVFFILASCQNSNNEEENKKTYKYIEIVAEQSAFGGVRQEEEEPKEIKAVSDSAAYLEAFKTFTISSKVSKDMIETIFKCRTNHTRPI